MKPGQCVNCGAPHNGHQCKYCGTYYTNNLKMYPKIDKLNRGEITPKQAFKTKIIYLVFFSLCAIGMVLFWRFYSKKKYL